MIILVLKPEVVASKRLSTADQEQLLQDVVDEVSGNECAPNIVSSTVLTTIYYIQALTNGVLITRLKSMPRRTPMVVGAVSSRLLR